jgi:peptidoglycan/LPS O-acetylase OafA/YrhL
MLWTMFIELNASAFMPVISNAQKQGSHYLHLLVLVFGLSFLSFLVQNHTKQVSVYLVTFAIGAAVPYLSDVVGRLCRRSRLMESISLIGAVIVLLWFRELIPRVHWPSYDPLIVQVEALAAMWIIALAMHRPQGYSMLRCRALTKLGDVSYGLYLLHFPILLVAVAAAERVFPPEVNRTALGFGIAATVYATTLIASVACYSFVEMPAVALGARVAQVARRRLALGA